MIGLVGVPDIGRDTGPVHREHGVLVQHRGTHVAQLPQFLIGNGRNLRRPVDDPRISHQETGYVRPVFVHVSSDSPGDQRPGDIAAAAGKGHDLPILPCAVKSRHHGGMAVLQQLGEQLLGLVVIQGSVIMEADAFRGIHEFPSQIIRHQQPAQVFSPARAPVPALSAGDSPGYFVQSGFDIRLQMKIPGDGQVSLPDLHKLLLYRPACGRQIIALIQQVRHLFIRRPAFAGGAGNQVFPRRLQLQNAAHLVKLFIIGQTAAAEFGDNTFKHEETPPIRVIPGHSTAGNAGCQGFCAGEAKIPPERGLTLFR